MRPSLSIFLPDAQIMHPMFSTVLPRAVRACALFTRGVPTQIHHEPPLRSFSFFLLSLPLACRHVCACRPQVARSRIAAKQPRAAAVVDPATDIPASGTCAAARSLAVAANSVVILLPAACWGQLVRASWVTGSQS